MSLRPAQELVHESSKFSLRHFFESQAIRSPAELSSTETFPTLNFKTDLALHSPAPPVVTAAPPPPPPPSLLRPHVPSVGAPPKDSKFTFTGLMPAATTPMQTQHKILYQHQQQALSQATATTNAKPGGLQSDNGNEVLRLKAQVLSLNERIAHSTANLTATSESVIRGNKALTTERAQFHSKYANLTKKLEATQSALAEAEALPKEAVNNSKLLNAKVLELQLENGKLVATRDALMGQLSEKEAAETSQATTAHTEEDLIEMRSKFISISAQHSSLLDKQVLLEHEIEAKGEMLEIAEGGLADATERADDAVAEVAELKERFAASQLEIAQTDSLVDELDEKLAAARVEVEVEPTASCCPATERCEEMERSAREALNKTNGASEHECARIHDEWKFLDGLAKRARHALTTGEPERVMVAHVYTGTNASEEPFFDLASHIGANPLLMGKSIDESCLHCHVTMRATGATGAAVEERDTSSAEARTNTFVQAVSKDLKFSMDGSQALYASSASTGVALRV